MPIAAPDNRQLAAAVMATFGGLCDVTVAQVSSVIATARRAAGERLDAEAQRRTVRDRLFIGGSHLTSMVHTLSFAFFSHAALMTTMSAVNVGGDVAVALVAAGAMAIVTELVTRLAVRRSAGRRECTRRARRRGPPSVAAAAQLRGRMSPDRARRPRPAPPAHPRDLTDLSRQNEFRGTHGYAIHTEESLAATNP